MAELLQWECVPCKIGPIGAIFYAMCPKCHRDMTLIEEAK